MPREPAKKTKCDYCGLPLTVKRFAGATPERQAEFVEVGAARLHVECASAKRKTAK